MGDIRRGEVGSFSHFKMMDVTEIKYVFNTSVLKKGDILLINTYDERMHRLQNSQYDHAALYAGDASIIESDGGGVALNHIFSYGFKDPNDAIVLRCTSDSEIIRNVVVFYARAVMGMEFGSNEAKRVRKYENTNTSAEENKMFCSRLVAESYEKVGVKLVNNSSYCTPSSLLNSTMLTRIENALEPASEDMRRIVAIHSKTRKNADNVEMLVDLLQQMSVFYALDVQTMDQLINAAIQHPERDDEALDQLRQTDYYLKRFEGRNQYCLNDKEAFDKLYPTLNKKVWFLLNQDTHLEKSWIPDISANVRAFSILTTLYPDSKVIVFFRDLFKELLNEYMDYHIWIDKLLIDLMENDPDGFKKVIAEG